MNQPNGEANKAKPMWQALSLAWELGYTIAIPLVALALVGRFADKWLGTSPWLLLVGVFLSIMITTWLVYRKTKTIVSSSIDNDMNDNNKDKPKETKV